MDIAHRGLICYRYQVNIVHWIFYNVALAWRNYLVGFRYTEKQQYRNERTVRHYDRVKHSPVKMPIKILYWSHT